MSEYWKSNPRKFCDFCKCWIADNKPSVDFHERGKRHKENVQIRLAEMAKKGKEDYEAQQQEGDFLKAMEEAALKAYKNDIEQNPDMTGSKISEIAASKNAEIVVATKKPPEEEKPKETAVPVKKWYEAKSPEGYCYYWNIETGASKWEEPEDGFLSLAEQEKLKKKKKKDKSEEGHSKEKKANNSKTLDAPPVVYGPAQKIEAYSTWENVKKNPEPEVDYQLPQIAEEYYGPEISFQKDPVTFEEKTVTLSANDKGGGQSVTFKKRKSAQDNKKSMRQRTNDL